MKDIEIPHEQDRRGHYRFFEVLPGVVSWSMLALPFVLSLINVTLAAFFLFVYLLINFARVMANAFRALQGYGVLQKHLKMPWSQMLQELDSAAIPPRVHRTDWHRKVVEKLQDGRQTVFMPSEEVIHAVIIATYKEAREVLEPTIKSLFESDFAAKKQIIFVLGYEGRAGERTETQALQLIKDYKGKFLHAMAVKHPADIPGEVIGKGGNITYAARELEKYLKQAKIDPKRVMVTTLDSDNRPHPQYFNVLTYTYMVAPDPIYKSYQPVSLYTNNIWDAPAPSRVLATGNTSFHLVASLRSHALRNFSAHAQPMAALIETDYWSVRSIVEDGHQFWRSFFRFEGKYRVLPLHVPIYQDAVLAETYPKTLKAQFLQLQRWTYGASDIAYVIHNGFFKKNKIPKLDMIAKTWRLFEGHITWAVGPLLILGGGFIPSLFNPKSYAANELPIIVSRIQTFALIGLFLTIFLALRTLPPKPARYRRHRSLWMVLQWVYLPITTIVFNSFAAFYSQTRLMFRRYSTKFNVTEKAVVVDTETSREIKV